MGISESDTQLSFSIIDTKMTVDAMRASGYRSTTHALAELIDNSFEASATAVELFGVSRRDASTGHFRLSKLAVLDNGDGMDSLTLRGSLRYGHGTRRLRKGMGRFGLGLPNSSMSQARRVDVWSWRTGATNALHTRLAIEDIERGMIEVPEPAQKPIPRVFRESTLNGFEDAGTLVLWSDLDRVNWRRASTTFRHTEILLGRIYRRFLASSDDRLDASDPRDNEIGEQRTLTCISVRDTEGSFETSAVVDVRPNDPLYLMANSSCPEDFGEGRMFQELKGSPFVVKMPYNGAVHDIRVRASYAPPHVRDPEAKGAEWPAKWVLADAGHTPWGKHAANNNGVSVMRAHREILLDESWLSGDDPRERWWKVEVDFPTALDDVFGVSNNKQATMTFERLARYDWRREAMEGENSPGDVRRRLERERDPRAQLLELRLQMEKAITVMRRRVREARRRRIRHTEEQVDPADVHATAIIDKRRKKGHRSASDKKGERGTEEQHKKEQVENLVERHHYDEPEAEREVDETSEKNLRVRWVNSAQDIPAFFSVDSLPNVMQVAFNTNHPLAAHHLLDLVTPDVEQLDEEALKRRMAELASTFRVLIYAWARYEDEQEDYARRKVRDARMEWGRYAEEFFDSDDGSVLPTDHV